MRHDAYTAARHEHAWLLRADGEDYRVIGSRLGVSPGRARQMVKIFGVRVRRAMWHVTHYGDCAILTVGS